MAYNTKQIVKDIDGNPISQYYNKELDKYEPVEGNSGGNKVVVENNDLSLIPILDKLSQLTGTVIDEETRKANEITRQSNETLRVNAETSRKNAENTRITSEKDRVTKETDRVAKETNRVDAEKVRVSNETTRQSNETARNSNENIRKLNETARISNENLRIALYDDLKAKLASGYFKGEKGDTGNGLEFIWRGTELGVRVAGQTNYVYVNLKGEKGDTGSIENLTKKHVTDALGYTPPTQDTNTTYEEISTAEIDAGTASTLRTVTGRRVKYILDKVSTMISLITKTDVGLGSVDNVKQMPISNGVLENYREKLVGLSGTTPTINLSLGNVFNHTLSGNTTYTISNAVNAQAHSFSLIITQNANLRTIIFPSSIKWQGEEVPDLSKINKTYILTFTTTNGGATWYGMFGGEF